MNENIIKMLENSVISTVIKFIVILTYHLISPSLSEEQFQLYSALEPIIGQYQLILKYSEV